MKIEHEFSQNAENYNRYNIIQTKVIQTLVERLLDRPASILDIGCGRGGVFQALDWPVEKFTGLDFADGMLALHPKAEAVSLHKRDFNDLSFLQGFRAGEFERVVSASSLQWAEDLDITMAQIEALNTPVTLAIFTSGTFKTLLETASISPLLRSAQEVRSIAENYFDAEYELLQYTLEFPSVREMFRYMKKSGVGGARNLLSYTQMKQLMYAYPLNYLEFEVLLIHEERREK